MSAQLTRPGSISIPPNTDPNVSAVVVAVVAVAAVAAVDVAPAVASSDPSKVEVDVAIVAGRLDGDFPGLRWIGGGECGRDPTVPVPVPPQSAGNASKAKDDRLAGWESGAVRGRVGLAGRAELLMEDTRRSRDSRELRGVASCNLPG